MSGFNAHEEHPTARTDTWLTPKPVIDALGPLADLDPCAAPDPKPWPTATTHYTWPAQDGLALPWFGHVWLNGPYSNLSPWMAKLAEHGNGIALTFARTETKMFFDSVWAKYGGVLFIKGRLKFCRPDGSQGGTAGAPSVLIGYGDEALRRLANTSLDGHLVIASAAIILRADGKPAETWRQVIQDAMAGKEVKLHDLYLKVEATGKTRCAKAKGVRWKEKIRRVLQEHFQPVARGVWKPA